MKSLRVALAQINSTVGDFSGNSKKIISNIKRAKAWRADIVAFPELAITGYPPEDLLLKPQFIKDNLAALKRISMKTEGIIAVIGFVDKNEGDRIYNAAAIITGKKVIDIYHKIILPNYGVFDEYRYFREGKRYPLYGVNGVNIGISICEDIWDKKGPLPLYAQAGADLIITINASPYERGKPQKRERILQEWSSRKGFMIAYLNAVGGQDELVFDGFSMVYDHTGDVIGRAKQFEEDLVVLDLDIDTVRKCRKEKAFTVGKKTKNKAKIERIAVPTTRHAKREAIQQRPIRPHMGKEEEIYRALVLGTADYVRKNEFRSVVIGLSGGVDSSLVATIAVDAIGRENVTGLFMPSRYTSEESREDSFQLAENLDIQIIEIAIDGVLAEYLEALRDTFRETDRDTTEENLQARIRGNLLMAFSNKFGWLVMTTGNKSEMSVGYATLYGDMAGGFAVVKDVPKTLVYSLSAWRNRVSKKAVIPDRVLWKEPTAELKPDQRDSDVLPPYPELDPILEAYIVEEKSFDEILKVGCELECTQKVISMVDRSEYKRRQSPPGIKITSRAFGRDRRFPITNRYRSY